MSSALGQAIAPSGSRPTSPTSCSTRRRSVGRGSIFATTLKFTDDMASNTQRVVGALKEAADYINLYYEVEDLCMSLPSRLETLVVEREGEQCKW